MKSTIELIIKDRVIKVSSSLEQKELSLVLNTFKSIEEDSDIISYYQSDYAEEIVEKFKERLEILFEDLQKRGFRDLMYIITTYQHDKKETIKIV